MDEERGQTAGEAEAAAMMKSMGMELPGEEKSQEKVSPWVGNP